MIEEIFRYQKVNLQKLKEYGFKKVNDKYQFETQIYDNQFDLIVFVTENGEISTKVIDKNLQDEYVLHLLEDSVGEFASHVRTEFSRVLTDIRDKCFEKEIFKSEQAKQVIEYVRTKYNDELEFLWEKFSNNAIWRRKDNDKWYGALLIISKQKLGLNSDEVANIIDLRADPEKLKKLIDNKKYFAGYHMNKKHWLTICLDGSVPLQTIKELLDDSYLLAKK